MRGMWTMKRGERRIGPGTIVNHSWTEKPSARAQDCDEICFQVHLVSIEFVA